MVTTLIDPVDSGDRSLACGPVATGVRKNSVTRVRDSKGRHPDPNRTRLQHDASAQQLRDLALRQLTVKDLGADLGPSPAELKLST